MTDKEKQLIEKNEYMIRAFCKSNELDINEWYGRFAVVLCESAIKYINYENFRRDKFEVFLHHKFVQSMKCALDNKTLSFNNSMVYLDDDVELPDGDIVTYGETLCADNPFAICEFIDTFYRMGLDERQLKILYFKYLGETQTDISKSLGYGQSNVSIFLSEILQKTKEVFALTKGEY